jgi:hypothetical protein
MQELNFLSYHDITVAGKFLAGLVSPTQNESFVTWHELAIPGGAVVNTKTFSLKKVWRVQVILMDLEMNQDGILLLRLGEVGKNHARYVLILYGTLCIPQSRAANSDTVD